MEKWKRLSDDRGGIAVGKVVGKVGKVGGKVVFCTGFVKYLFFEQIFTRVLRRDFSRVLHEFCTFLAINFFLDFLDLVAKSKVEFEI